MVSVVEPIEVIEIKNSNEDLESITASFIADFEGFRDCAYWDIDHWSIWYWTRSYQWECISEEEALERKKDYIRPILSKVDNGCYTDNQKIAIVSYIYNVWGWAMNISSYVAKCDIASIKYIMWVYWYSAWGVRLAGLVKRRGIELQKFNS